MHIDRLIITRTLSCLLTFLALACGGKSTGVDEDFIESDASVDKGDAEVDEGDFTGCGDGILDPENDEQCDGDNLGYATCLSIGYGPGILVCNDACYFDITGCGEPQEDELGETGLPGISIWDWLNQDTETGQNEDSDNNPFTDWFGGNDDSGFFGNSDRGGLFGNDDSGFFGNSDRGGLFGNNDSGFFGNSDRGGLFGNDDGGFFGNSDRGGLFGNDGGGLFGNDGGGLFGNDGGGLFGDNGGGLFGDNGGGLFGNNGGGLFGNNGGGLFGRGNTGRSARGGR